MIATRFRICVAAMGIRMDRLWIGYWTGLTTAVLALTAVDLLGSQVWLSGVGLICLTPLGIVLSKRITG